MKYAETDPFISDSPPTLADLSSKYSAPYIQRMESSFIYSGMVWGGQSYDTVNFYNMEFDNKLVPYENIAKPAIALRRNGLRMYGLFPEDEKQLHDFVTESVQRYMDAERYVIIDNFSSSRVEPDGTIVFTGEPWGNYRKCAGSGTKKDFKDHIVATQNIDREITCLKMLNLVGVQQFRLKLPPDVYRTYTANTLIWRNVYIVVRRDKDAKWKMEGFNKKYTLPVIAESFYAANNKGEILFGANLNQSVAVAQTRKPNKPKQTKKPGSQMDHAPKIKYTGASESKDSKVEIDINGR